MFLTPLMKVCCAPLKVITMALLVILIAILTGCSTDISPQPYEMKEGEIGELHCSKCRPRDAETLWESHTNQGVHLYNNMSAAEQRQMGVVVHRCIIVILSASVKHHGNYSLSLRNSSKQCSFSLAVYTTQSREYKEYEESTQVSQTCYTFESCTLHCPLEDILTSTLINTTWQKRGKSSPQHNLFKSVTKEDSGTYTCTKSYFYDGQKYNMTATVILDVKPQEVRHPVPTINKPKDNEVFYVDLDSSQVIDCEAVLATSFDQVFWLSGSSFVGRNSSLPVFYNYTWNSEKIKMTASLIFRRVSEEDLSKNYTCKLQSAKLQPRCVTISLAKKARRSYTSLALCTVSIVVVMAVTVVIYVKFRIDITLFLRDTLGCSSSTSDGKSYDAFLMCYKCDMAGGLNAQDKKWLESVLEERFGYSLCLYDRDVLPGEAVAEAVLDCVEKSRTVVLVPISPEPDLGSGLLSAIHEALVERQTHLIFINTETAEVSRSGSLPEALQLLSEAGDSVTWKGTSSMLLSSSFLKHLRYYLPAPQRAYQLKFLSQAMQDFTL